MFHITNRNDKLVVEPVFSNNIPFKDNIYVYCHGVINLSFDNIQFCCNKCTPSQNCDHVIATQNYINDHHKLGYNFLYLSESVNWNFEELMKFFLPSPSFNTIMVDVFDINGLIKYVNDISTTLFNIDHSTTIPILTYDKIILFQKIICCLLSKYFNILKIHTLELKVDSEHMYKWLWLEFFIMDKYYIENMTALNMYVFLYFDLVKLKMYTEMENFINVIVNEQLLKTFNCGIKMKSRRENNFFL